ncbi:MAG: alpha/beta fold hydrolase [Chloroflexi bacterium]|nr:alpha/beta fold hydrolase [Chloroflexota bacterium]
MEKQIRYCTASDGVRIAYTTYGPSTGYPLIFVPGWVSHLDHDAFIWDLLPQALIALTGGGLQIARYDKRGTGLSQRGVDLSLEARSRDIDAVADALNWQRFALDGVSEGGPIAMAYAATRPQRVSHLIVYGAFARGLGDSIGAEAAEAMLQLIASQWGLASDIFTNRLMAGASAEDIRRFGELQRQGATAEDATALLRMNSAIDLVDVLPTIEAPTLVAHGREDQAVPFERGREIAQLIPNARFVAHAGGHYPKPQDSAVVLEAIVDFLADVTTTAPGPSGDVRSAPADVSVPDPAPRHPRLVTIVFTDIERNTEILRRLGDAAWRQLLREHERITRDQLKAFGGAEIKTIGDAFMASFDSATRALECAIALQRSFADWNESESAVSAAPLHVRIGINAGEPIDEDGDLFGTSVTVASRIAGMAAGDEVLASNVVRELVAGKGFLFSDRGDAVLRGFEDPVRVWEVRWL